MCSQQWPTGLQYMLTENTRTYTSTHTHTGCMGVSGDAVSRMHANRHTTNGCTQYSQYSAVVLLQGQRTWCPPRSRLIILLYFLTGFYFYFIYLVVYFWIQLSLVSFQDRIAHLRFNVFLRTKKALIRPVYCSTPHWCVISSGASWPSLQFLLLI